MQAAVSSKGGVPWGQLRTDFESQVSAIINRLEPFNDPKSPRLAQLAAAKVAINALLQFMVVNGLAPNAITGGEELPDE